jgi:hypothetical protein
MHARNFEFGLRLNDWMKGETHKFKEMEFLTLTSSQHQ